MINLFFEWQDRLTTITLIYARIVPIFLIVPVLSSGVLANMLIRNGIIFAIIIGLWPTLDTAMPVLQSSLIDYLVLATKETMVGASIGFILAVPFWIFNAFGSYIDVARGSSMGAMMDPTSGQESTEVQNFINFCVCAMYLQLGGMKVILEALVQSYQHIGLKQGISVNMDFVIPFLCQVFNNGFVLAAPVLLALLLTEALLGLLSRFTPQLSAFSIAMTIKSTIALVILSLYFFQVMPDRLLDYMHGYSHWNLLDGVDFK
jgi:type III secretion protein SpaR/YscT/HrcT